MSGTQASTRRTGHLRLKLALLLVPPALAAAVMAGYDWFTQPAPTATFALDAPLDIEPAAIDTPGEPTDNPAEETIEPDQPEVAMDAPEPPMDQTEPVAEIATLEKWPALIGDDQAMRAAAFDNTDLVAAPDNASDQVAEESQADPEPEQEAPVQVVAQAPPPHDPPTPGSAAWWLDKAAQEAIDLSQTQPQAASRAMRRIAGHALQQGDDWQYQRLIEALRAAPDMNDQDQAELAGLLAQAGDVEAALVTAQRIADPSIKVDALMPIAAACRRNNDLAGYARTVELSRQSLTQITNPAQQHQQCLALVRLRLEQSELDAAMALTDQMTDQPAAPTRSAAMALVSLACFQNGDAETALRLSESISDPATQLDYQIRLARTAAQVGEDDFATAIARQLDDPRLRAMAHLQIAEAQLARGHRGDYQQHYQAALNAVADQGPKAQRAVLGELARMQSDDQRYYFARKTIAQLAAIPGSESQVQSLYAHLAEVRINRGQFIPALKVIEKNITDPQLRDQAMANLAATQAQVGLLDAAERKLDQVVDANLRRGLDRQLAATRAEKFGTEATEAWVASLDDPARRINALLGAAAGTDRQSHPQNVALVE